jgi:hypothetical protein
MINFAQVCMPHKATKLTLIYIKLGYNPRMSFNYNLAVKPTTAKDKLSVEEATALAKRIEQV